jgi:hypothetical protein
VSRLYRFGGWARTNSSLTSAPQPGPFGKAVIALPWEVAVGKSIARDNRISVGIRYTVNGDRLAATEPISWEPKFDAIGRESESFTGQAEPSVSQFIGK